MALARGTLFPGLDLPFMNLVNKPADLSTPLCELMAMDFVIRELNLYLDTHPMIARHSRSASVSAEGTSAIRSSTGRSRRTLKAQTL